MNSIQLMQRLARNLAIDDSSNPPADALLDILQAINAGIITFYKEVPGIYKRTVVSLHIPAPQNINITYSKQYSHIVTGLPFLTNQNGCTIRHQTGDADTIITGANTVLDDWLSPNLGPIPAIIYSDTIPLQDVVQDVVGSVRCYDNSQSQPTLLIRDERLRGGRSMWWNWPWDQWGDSWYPLDGWLFGSVGRPRYYYLEAMGQSQGAEPEFVLRLVPFPDIDYTIRFEAELYPQRILFQDLTNARSIDVPDAHVNDCLIPLCEAELITSPFWRDKELKPIMLQRQERVLERTIPKMPKDVGAPVRLIGTPRGY